MSELQQITVGIEKAFYARGEQIAEVTEAARRGDHEGYNALKAQLTERASRRRSIAEIRAEYLAAARG